MTRSSSRPGQRRKLGEILVTQGSLGMTDLDQALHKQDEVDLRRRLGAVLIEMGLVDENAVARALAEQLGLEVVDPMEVAVDPALVWRVPRLVAEKYLILALDRPLVGGKAASSLVRVAMADPTDEARISELEFLLGARIQRVVAAPDAIRHAILRHYDLSPLANQLLVDVPADMRAPVTSPTALELDAKAISANISGKDPSTAFRDVFNFLLVNAIERGASDIHIEPQEHTLRVRYRVDGALRTVLELPGWASAALLSRVKVVGKMKVFENRRPQDGTANATLGNRTIDLRISTVPGQYGETAVIRLLDPAMLKVDLSELGWQRGTMQRFFHLVSQTQGLVLVVGPTGSGKSTTLYASINRLRRESTSIYTLEDPVEYRIPGINQIQVDSQLGVGFAEGIRSLLRQDPDVMVIGEIRDPESAEAALEAANTGHLVLSTLHTGHAVGALTRLRDLGVPPYLIGASLLGVVAQRLIRKVCPVCSLPGQPIAEDWKRMNSAPIDLGPNARRVGPGCPSCAYVGYKGRIGVYEVASVDDEMRELILRQADERELWECARKGGLTTMMEDGLEKVRHGMTTLEELAGEVPPVRWDRRRPTAPPPTLPPQPVPAATSPVAVAEPFTEDSDAPTIAAPTAPTTAPPPPASASKRTRAVVLVVDDAPEIRALIGATLEDDFELRFAADGLEALAEVARDRPDAMVLDVMMPNLSGYEVCARLKADPATEALPILILSARGERTHVKEGLRVGADDYLPKPFDPEELELRLRALLRRSGALGKT
jgi:type IV pilus assembly protein PilB